MPKITAAIDAIDKQITKLEKDITKAGSEANKLSTYMRIDPTNVEHVTEKWENLRKKLKSAQEAHKLYVEREKELRAELKKTEKGTDAYTKLQDELTKTQRDADKLKRTIDELNKRFEIGQDKTELARAKTAQLNEKYKELAAQTKKVARAVALATTAIVAFVKKSINAAEETYSLAKSYGVSAESIQLYGRALENATGQSDLYTKSLKAMSTGLAQVSAGRGVAYAQALKNIGLSAKDLATMSRDESFRLIFQQLQNIANETERASAAQVLFGESGLYVAQVAGQGAAAWNEYLEVAKEYGIITDEQAEKAHQVNIEYEKMKSKLQAAGVELGASFLPLIEALTPMIAKLAGGIKWVGLMFEKMGTFGQVAAVGLLIGIMLVPKAISLYLALSKSMIAAGEGAKIGATGMATFQASAAYVLAVIAVVAIAIIGLAAAFGAFKKKSQETAESVTDDWGKVAETLKNSGIDASAAVEQYSYESTEKTVNMYVEITGKGDTTISDAAASTVALLTVDQFNKQLGELTK